MSDEQLPLHDREALVEQAVRKESLADPIRCPRDPSWREHYLDAIEAYERAGRSEDAERVRGLLSAPTAAEAKAEEKLPEEPAAAPEDLAKPAKRRGRPA